MRSGSIPTSELSSLRMLRLWHWRKAMSARRSENKHVAEAERYEAMGRVANFDRHRAGNDGRRADFHIKAVQLLNDVVPGTAEEDDRGDAKVQR
jgi:hypothetical protein